MTPSSHLFWFGLKGHYIGINHMTGSCLLRLVGPCFEQVLLTMPFWIILGFLPSLILSSTSYLWAL